MMEKQIMELNKRYARKKMLKRIVALLCVFVMLFTVNSLKMVAQTLTRTPMCGLKEHQHKAKCYDASGNLVCGKVEHQHTDACYQESPTLEIEDDAALPVDGLQVDGGLDLDLDAGSLDSNALDLNNDLVVEDVATPVQNNAPEIPTYKLGSKALLSNIIESTGLNIKIKKIREVGIVDNDGSQVGLVEITKKDNGDYRIKALRDFDQVELAIVLADEVVVVKLLDGVAPAEPVVEEPAAPQVEEAQPAPAVEVEQPEQPAPADESEQPELTVPETEDEQIELAGQPEPAVTEEQADLNVEDAQVEQEEVPAAEEMQIEAPVVEDAQVETPVVEAVEPEQPEAPAVVEEVEPEQPEAPAQEEEAEPTEAPAEEEAAEPEPTEAPVVEEPAEPEQIETPVAEEEPTEVATTEEEPTEVPAVEEPVEASVDEEAVPQQTEASALAGEIEAPVVEEAAAPELADADLTVDVPADEAVATEPTEPEQTVSVEEPEVQIEETATEETAAEEIATEETATEEKAAEEIASIEEEAVEPAPADAQAEQGDAAEEPAPADEQAEQEDATEEPAPAEEQAEQGDAAEDEAAEPALAEAQAPQEDGEEAAEIEGEETTQEEIDQLPVAVDAETADGEAGEPEQDEAAVYTAGSREIPVNDAVVTLTWPVEAKIPEDVVITIEEIEKGTEDYDLLYHQALAELPEPDQAVTQVMRFFDITLYTADGQKIEPKAPVSVVVSVNETIDSEVSALHCKEVGAPMETVDANAEGESVAFDAPSFSVYGVNYQVPAEQENVSSQVQVDLSRVDTMGAATVDGMSVSLSVADLLAGTDDAVESTVDSTVDAEQFVAEATVSSADITVENGQITLPAEALEKATVSLQLETKETGKDYITTVTTHTVDIVLSDYAGRTGETVGEGVTVKAVGENSLPADAQASVVENVEVPESVEVGENESATAFDINLTNANGDAITGPVAVTVMPSDLNVLSEVPEGAVAKNVVYTLIHVHDDGTVENVALPADAVVVDENGKVESFSFETESFSMYVLKYTVDFEYADPETDKKTAWSWPGEGSYKIADIMAEIGVTGEISDVTLECIEGEQIPEALYLEEKVDGWYLTSECAFDETYELGVVVVGNKYVITITDEQVNERVTAEAYFLNTDGTRTNAAETESGKTLEAKLKLSNSSANENEDAYIKLSLEGMDEYIRMNESFLEKQWDHITFRDMSTNQEFQIGVYYDPDQKCIVYKVPAGATGIVSLSFTTPNGITPDNDTLTLRPELVDSSFTHIEPEANDKIGQPVTGTWTSEFGWNPIQKYVNNVKENTVAVTKNASDQPVIDGWLRYDYSASSQNRAETGVRWTNQAVITDTLTLPEGMTFGGNYIVDKENGRIYIDGAPANDNILFGLTLKENMKITDLQVVGNNKIEYTIEVDNPYTTRTDAYAGDLAREMDDISFTTELNASAITLASDTITNENYGKAIINKVNVTETPNKGDEQEKSSDQVKTVTKKDEGYKLDKNSNQDGQYVEADDLIDYTITVTNTGSVVIAAADSVITDSLPSAVYLTEEQKAALQQAVTQANTDASVTIDGNNLTINTGDIAVGGSFTVTFHATVKDAKALKDAGYTNESTINNTAVYRGLSDYVASKVHMGEITPEKTSNLDEGQTLQDGGTVQFTLTAKNTTAYDYKGDVYFYDDIPAYMKVKLYNSQGNDVTSTAYATPGTYNAEPTPTYYVKDSDDNLVPATITINNDGSIRVQVTKSNLTVSKNGGSYSLVLDATFDASKVNGNLGADGNVKYTNQVSINNNQAHTDVYGEIGKLGIDKYATDATYNGQGVSAPYIDGTVVSYKIHVVNDPAKPYKQDIVVTDTLPRGLFPVGLTVGGTVYTTWQDFVTAFGWEEKDATIQDAGDNTVDVKAQQKYNSLQLTWTITNPISENKYVTEQDITYKATVVNSDLVNRTTGIQDLVNKASVMGLSDDETIEIEVQGINIDKKIVGKNGDEVSPCETILVSPGDFITYELTIENPKHIATTVTGITDSMPFGGNGSPMPISWWQIGSTVSVDETTAGKHDFVTRSATYTNNDANYGNHYWLDNGYLKFGNIDITPADDKLVQRITLTYPTDPAALHSMFVGSNYGRTEKNTFSVDNLPPEDVTHTEPANKKYSIQKSVIGLAKISEGSRLPSKDLFQQGSVEDVFYTVMVVNTGLTSIHLNSLTDVLPAELNFVAIAENDYEVGSHTYNDVRQINTASHFNNPNYVVPTGYVGLEGVKVLAVPDGNTVSFTLNGGEGVDIPEKTLLAFDVQCKLKNGVTLTDGQPITNTIQAELDADAVMSKLPIKTRLTKDDSVQNNGDCEVVSNDGAVQIAESSVTIHPSNVAVPGILKQAVAYKEQSQGQYDANWTSIADKTVSINSQSKVKWKITLYNDGTVPINEGYKLEDNIYNHHVYESIESFRIYNAAGNASNIDLNSAELRERTAENGAGFTTDDVGHYKHYTFTFPRGDKYTIPVGGRVELELVTVFVSGMYDGQLDNTAIFSPVQKCNYDCVIHGQREKNEEGTEYTGVSSMDYVNMLGSGATMSYKGVAPKSNPTQVAYGYDVSTGENYITVDDADELVTYTNHIQNLSNNTFAAFTLIDRMPEIGDTGVVNQSDRRNSEYTVDFADALNLKLAFRNNDGSNSIPMTATDYTLQFSDKTDFSTEDWNGTAAWSDSPVGAKSFRLVLNSDSLYPKINALVGSHLTKGVFPSKWVLEVSYDGKLSADATAGQYAWNSFGYHYQTADETELSAEPPKVGVRIRPVPVLKKQVLDREGMDQGIDESVVFTFRFYEGEHTLTDVESLTPIWEPQVYQGQAVQLKPKRTVNGETTGHFEEGHVYTVVETPADGYSLLDFEKNGLKQSTVGYCVFTYTNDQNTTIVCQNQLSGFAPEATKTLRARLPRTLQNEEFTFDLYPVTGLDMENLGAVETVSATAAQTASNTANGAVNFDILTYTEAGTYYYIMKEVPGSDTTVNYDDASYLVKVDVVEQSGKFKATGSYYKVTASESDPIVSVQVLASGVVPSFVNTESTQIQVTKVWAGNATTGSATMVLYRTTGESAAVPTDKFPVTINATTDNTPAGSAYITVSYIGDKGDSGNVILSNSEGWSKTVNLNRNEVYSFSYTPDGTKVTGVDPASTTGVSAETSSIALNATVKPSEEYTVTFTVPQSLKEYNDGIVTVTNRNTNETITFGKDDWANKAFTVMEEDAFSYSVSVDGKFITNITNASGSFASVTENKTVALGDFTTTPKTRNVAVSLNWGNIDSNLIPSGAAVEVQFNNGNSATLSAANNWTADVTLSNLNGSGDQIEYAVTYSPASATATDDGDIVYSGAGTLTGDSYTVNASYTAPLTLVTVTIVNNVPNYGAGFNKISERIDGEQAGVLNNNTCSGLVTGKQYYIQVWGENVIVEGTDGEGQWGWYPFIASAGKVITLNPKSQSNATSNTLSTSRTLSANSPRKLSVSTPRLASNGASGSSGSKTFFDSDVGGSGDLPFTAIRAKDLPAGAEIVTDLPNCTDGNAQNATITITNGTHTWSNLPAVDEDGHTIYYYVVEKDATADADRMSVRYAYEYNTPGDPASGIKKVTITNTTEKDAPQTGNLSVTKTVASGDTNKDFTFTVTLDDTSINGTYGDMTFTNGVAEFTLKHNETKTATGLPVGITYTVTEASASGYTSTYTGETGTIPAGQTANATFTNTYSSTGSVPFKAKKTLVGGTLTAEQFSFTLTETDSSWNALSGGVTQTQSNAAPAGSATFGEIDFDDVILSDTTTRYFTIKETVSNADGSIIYDQHEQRITVAVTDNREGNLLPSKSYEQNYNEPGYDASFVNTKKGALQITKTVTVDDANPTDSNKALASGIFTFTIKDGNNDEVAGKSPVTITYANGVATAYRIGEETKQPITSGTNIQSVIVSDLVPGTYTVTETAVTGFTTTASGGTNVTGNVVTVLVTAGETTPASQAQASFTNNTETTSITVTKQWAPVPSSAASIKFSLYAGTSHENAAGQNSAICDITLDGTADNGSSKPYTPVDGMTVQINAQESNAWIATFSDLPKYVNGVQQFYVVKEEAVAGYTTIYPSGQTYATDGQTITNTGDASVVIQASKSMTGGEVPTNGKFNFTLTANDGAPMPDDSTNGVKTVTNSGDSISFGSIAYELNDMGGAAKKTFTYTLREVLPEGATEANNYTVAGIRYDPTVYTVTVKLVYDSSNGSLSVDRNYPAYTRVFGEQSVTTWTSASFENEEFVDIPVRKAWSLDDPNTTWPENVTQVVVGLYAGNDPVQDENNVPRTLTLTAAQPSGSFDAMPKYDNGTRINYSVKEISVTMSGATYNDASTMKLADIFDPTVADNGTITNKLHKAEIKIVKVEKGNVTRKLDGAVFKLMRVKSDGTPDETRENITTQNGEATINDLLPGTYQLTETSAPTGYILTLKTITFTVDTNGNVTYDATTGDNALNAELGMVTYTAEDSELATLATFTISNEPGVALPATGGPGTTLYYVAGAAMVLLALGLLLYRKRNYD